MRCAAAEAGPAPQVSTLPVSYPDLASFEAATEAKHKETLEEVDTSNSSKGRNFQVTS